VARSSVLGPTPAEAAAFCLARDTANLAVAEARYAAACKALGAANRLKGYSRTRYVAEAFRLINGARAGLRRARAAWCASLAAAAPFAPRA